MKSDQIAVCGSFGFGNAGDEAVPLALQDMLQELGLKHRLSVVSRFRSGTLDSITYMGPQDAQRRKELAGVPMLVCGGGVIEPHPAAVLYRARPLLRSAAKGKAAVLGSSVEPGVRYGLRARLRLLRSLMGLGTVYTRDKLSERSLNKIAPWVKTETIGDLVLWMKPQHDTPLLAKLALPSRYISVVLAPRWSEDAGWTTWITDELAALARKLDAAIVFVPMSSLHDDDRVEHRRIATQLAKHHGDVKVVDVQEALEPREVCSLLARSILTTSMRLHGCVMAYAQRVPIVCIAYHPKLLGFSETVDCMKSTLPHVHPDQQTSGFYGYDFPDLRLKPGDLIEVAEVAMKSQQYARLDEFKTKSLNALKQFLAR
ncbi:polysaccharide pyruvyl transferase family protein [Rhizobacter sp. J219]|uniref:polysaccharide pyruvyl transferase family protein n=1 Tax=Rhizobacter sp. J219 TaxID=2898430 RepID=UPI002151A695|nr:polysaccharide pyruvyl transferase family protein [Rhizobacter sp. J219]MCR5883539.1 polysaccharide pyruvyl transferase family protein [Rhizobacter sp. J219]